MNRTSSKNFFQCSYLLEEFITLTGLQWAVDEEVIVALRAVEANLIDAMLPKASREAALMRACNGKLDFYADTYRAVLDRAAAAGVLFNYHQKQAVRDALNSGERAVFARALSDIACQTPACKPLCDVLESLFSPLSWCETRGRLHQTLQKNPNRHAICHALLAAYVFSCFALEEIHNFFACQTISESPVLDEQPQLYLPRFADYLRAILPNVWSRPSGLAYLRLDETLLSSFAPDDYASARRAVLQQIRAFYQALANHCYLCVHIKPMKTLSKIYGEDVAWALAADITLYAERLQQTRLETGYFHPHRIADETLGYIEQANAQQCRFDLAHTGFHYKDCFVVTLEDEAGSGDAQQTALLDLVLLFEKNKRDETVVPCPACRSWQVRGNSYPTLGVRSWECMNRLCPERSKSDRGNRYSMVSLLRQEAIEDERAQIPVKELRLWKRDVACASDETEITRMLARHYSLPDDKVLVCASSQFLTRLATACSPFLDREVCYFSTAEATSIGTIGRDDPDTLSPEEFEQSPFFERFCLSRPEAVHPKTSGLQLVPLFPNLSSMKNVEIYCGDCFDVLGQINPESVDGVVTSPPYYNARDYATWPNIYAYLFDQWNVILRLHQVLKPGGLVLFNVFDYFDNDRTIVFSDMGKKRIILSSYASHLFRRAGFCLIKNVVWDKGEIEGKRNFNQGNRSPYYQAPFNCWEHIWVFSKGAPTFDVSRLPTLLREQPVTKMVRGANVVGHTAPYPEAIPNLLLDLLPPSAHVVDPYAGSFTSICAALKSNKRGIGIDYKRDYCELGLRRLKNQFSGQLSLSELMT